MNFSNVVDVLVTFCVVWSVAQVWVLHQIHKAGLR